MRLTLSGETDERAPASEEANRDHQALSGETDERAPASDEAVRVATTPTPAARVLMFLVSVYRAVLSPIMGQSCRFHPTCSAYSLEALRLHGAVRGGWLTVRRIGRCQPFHPGGYDPVPQVER